VIVTVPISILKVPHNTIMVSTKRNFVCHSHEHTPKADMDVSCRSDDILANMSTDWRICRPLVGGTKEQPEI
jgi:hypothetical protein